MKKTTLKLRRETIGTLTAAHLKLVRGGSFTCPEHTVAMCPPPTFQGCMSQGETCTCNRRCSAHSCYTQCYDC